MSAQLHAGLFLLRERREDWVSNLYADALRYTPLNLVQVSQLAARPDCTVLLHYACVVEGLIPGDRSGA